MAAGKCIAPRFAMLVASNADADNMDKHHTQGTPSKQSAVMQACWSAYAKNIWLPAWCVPNASQSYAAHLPNASTIHVRLIALSHSRAPSALPHASLSEPIPVLPAVAQSQHHPLQCSAKQMNFPPKVNKPVPLSGCRPPCSSVTLWCNQPKGRPSACYPLHSLLEAVLKKRPIQIPNGPRHTGH